MSSTVPAANELPHLQVQRRIVAVDELARRERGLAVRTGDQRREFPRLLLAELATGAPASASVSSAFVIIRYIFGTP